MTDRTKIVVTRPIGNRFINSITPDGYPRPMGVGRDPNNHKFVDVAFSRPLSDDELRDFHEFIRGWKP